MSGTVYEISGGGYIVQADIKNEFGESTGHFGPFDTREAGEACVFALIRRPDVRSAYLCIPEVPAV